MWALISFFFNPQAGFFVGLVDAVALREVAGNMLEGVEPLEANAVHVLARCELCG